MALWNALAPAATVAQLVGADAAGLISAILHAVRTARRNRKECRSLARRVMMVADLLQLVQQGSETMRRPEVRRALDGLGGALRRAYELVESCQEHGAAYGFIMAGRQAEQFRDVQGEIDSYLLVFPVVSHIDITIRLDRIYNMLLPSGHDNSQQVPQVVPGLPTSHLELDARNEGSALGGFQLESSQTITEIFEFEEHQRAGSQGSLEDQRFKWLCWLPQQDAAGSSEHSAYDLLKAATNNFSSENIIGSGGWSTVYKAHIGDGLEVAIKRYRTNGKSSASQCDSEFQVVKKLQHTNIIKLLGRCTGPGENVLVYEYMPNGSLDEIFFDVTRTPSLDWMSRFHIMEGIAQGLLYVHTHELCIVHKDLKPSNILLDSNMNAKISDFGIAKILLCPGSYHETRIEGTYGYLAPEFFSSGILSTKVDVYAYGVILLQAISAKKPYDARPQDDQHAALTEHAWHLWEAGRSLELIDPSLRNGAETTDITRCIQIALLCVQTDPADRPSMSDVVLMLSNKKTISAPKPLDFFPAEVFDDEATWTSSEIT